MPDFFDPLVLQHWLSGLGSWSWPVFLALQIVQVLVFWIPGEVVQIAGGMVFGLGVGTLLSSAGLAVGNLVAFALARNLGKDRLDRWLSAHDLERWARLVHHPRLELILGVIFFLPFVPKDVFCYLAGLSSIKPFRFFWLTTLARIPSLALSTWMGALAVQGLGTLLLIVLTASTVLGLVIMAFRKSLLTSLTR